MNMRVIFAAFLNGLFLLSVLSCKKDKEPERVEFDYLSTPCKIKSYISVLFPFHRVSAKYNSEGLLVELVGQSPGYRTYEVLEYNGRNLKEIVVPEMRSPYTGELIESFVKKKYTYGSRGIEKIQTFKQHLNGTGNAESTYETDRFEFTPGDGNKPSRMVHSINLGDQEDKFVVNKISEFRYDANGNLSEELVVFSRLLPEKYKYNYYYDDNKNTLKAINFMNFSFEDAARVFSQNNLVKSEIVEENKPIREAIHHLTFDSNNNVTRESFREFDVNWTCD